jgi:putative transposase
MYIGKVKRLQAFKYELMPTGEHQRLMRRFAGSRRFVFNKALALQIERRERGEKKLSYFGLCAVLTEWKKEFPWLCDTHSQVLQQALKDLEKAFEKFFAKTAGFPKFKKRGLYDRFRFPQGFDLEEQNNRVFLPKIGWVRYRNSRKVLGEISNVTVSCHGGRWYVSIQTEREVEKPVHPATSDVGIDMGIVQFATLSNGEVFFPLNSFRKHARRLRKAQQRMSRKKKFSNNWFKEKRKIGRIHAGIANARYDYLHKTSTIISKNHAVVCIEDLKIKNMSKSAAGTLDSPGKNVRAKSGLNKSILDQGWHEFHRQLFYKLNWLGGELVVVSPRNTSQTCPECDYIAKENRLTQSQFKCIRCDFQANADTVGSINVLRAGYAQLACQANGAVMPSATGTPRSDLNRNGLGAVGITSFREVRMSNQTVEFYFCRHLSCIAQSIGVPQKEGYSCG